MRSSRLVPIVVMSVACAGASAPKPAAPSGGASVAAYRAVHVDTLAPDKVAQFVAARKTWVAELARDGASDGRGVFVQVGDHEMYTIRSFARFDDFDTRGDAIDRSLAKVPKAAADAYDHDADTSLVFPHHTEVWQLDADLSYAPAAGALDETTAAVGRLVVDDVRPDPASEDAYGRAVADEDRALAAARYPLTRLGFRTTFGAGHVYTLWLASSREALAAAPTVEAAVASVRGADAAAAIMAAQAGAVERRTTQPLVVRHDLTRLVPP